MSFFLIKLTSKKIEVCKIFIGKSHLIKFHQNIVTWKNSTRKRNYSSTRSLKKISFAIISQEKNSRKNLIIYKKLHRKSSIRFSRWCIFQVGLYPGGFFLGQNFIHFTRKYFFTLVIYPGKNYTRKIIFFF